MKLLSTRRRVMMSAAIALGTVVSSARADVVAVSPAAFPAGSALITFTGIPDFTDGNGLVVDGVQFLYSLGFGQVAIGGGPPIANNVSLPALNGNSFGVLRLILPSLQNIFGVGYALETLSPVPNGIIISLFNGATNVGTLPYNAVPDPIFAGGFAGIQSTLAFNRVDLSFSPFVNAFAVDNIRFANTAVVTPEPATFALVLTGLAGIGFLRRRRRS